MSKQLLKLIWAGLVFGLISLGCKNAAPNGEVTSNSSAMAHGAELLKTQCLTCHGDDLIQQQRLNKLGWTREVEKMMRWGAEVKDADKDHLIEYLTANYPQRPFSKEPTAAPAPAVDAAVIARGKTLFEAKCLACHGDDLVKQQRLSKQGWTREVEKMVRWGAEVSDEEKPALVEYLLTQNNSTKK
ncbi:MAG TPA: c-type cytochrome [Blastocatellia bacterium]|nr:c-type cytochrome [Blastocatellia bacterium]